MTNTFDEELNKVIGKIALKVASEIKRNAPVDTGRFRNSIVAAKEGNNWVVGSNLDYAEDIEFGTAPHEIRAKPGKALFWKGAAHPVKKVNHPGTKGQYIFQKASIKAKSIVADELRKLQ